MNREHVGSGGLANGLETTGFRTLSCSPSPLLSDGALLTRRAIVTVRREPSSCGTCAPPPRTRSSTSCASAPNAVRSRARARSPPRRARARGRRHARRRLGRDGRGARAPRADRVLRPRRRLLGRRHQRRRAGRRRGSALRGRLLRPVRLALVRQPGADRPLERPVIDVNYVLAYEPETSTPGATSARWRARSRCTASPSTSTPPPRSTSSGMRSKQRALRRRSSPRAGCRWRAAPRSRSARRRFVDGGLASPIPVDEASPPGPRTSSRSRRGPTACHAEPSRLADRLHRAPPAPAQPRARDALPRPHGQYEATVDDLARRSLDAGAGPPHVLGLRPPAETPVVGQLERRSAVLAAAAAEAERLVAQTPGLTPATTRDGRPTSRAARRA